MALSPTYSQNAQKLELDNASSDARPPICRSTADDNHATCHLIAPPQSLFRNARNFEVKDSQFNTVANGNVTINNNTINSDPLTTILCPHVAAGAIFDSAAQHTAGKCHPGTRTKIIERIVDWIEDPNPTKHVLWIYGAAGAGKSALAHTICELLKQYFPDNDGGSFFFSSGFTDRGNALKLFATLAYQLAIQFPPVRAELNDLLFRNPSLPTKSMETQLFSLIIQPLLRCQTHLSHSPVVIIDGLDECENDKGITQADIVALISKSVVEHNVPLRFIILSRPEYWIRDAFDTRPLPDITLTLSLRDDVDADKDIRAYLTDEFERIRVENKRFMRSVIPPWPPLKLIDRFVEEASGQYVYAATVLQFIGNLTKFSNPQKQLDILTSPGPHRALAFSQLDRLYATILSAYPHWEFMKRVLAALLLGANLTILTVVLGMNPDELAMVLDALSSLINIKKPKSLSEDQIYLESIFDSETLQYGLDLISFSHRSFGEFLQDETRSGAFYIDLDSNDVPRDLLDGYFNMVRWNLDQNYEVEPHIFLKIDLVTYNDKIPRMTDRSTPHCSVSMLLSLITQMTAKLELFDPGRLTHMHSVFYFIHGMEYLQLALHACFDKDLPGRGNDKENPEMLTDFRTACKNLQEAINLARHGALSALTSCTDFRATPTLVYLTEYGWLSSSSLPLDRLRTIAGVGDVIPALRQHRYILRMSYDTNKGTWISSGYFLFWGSYTAPDWRSQGAWRDLRALFAHKSLKSILTRAEMDLETNKTFDRHTVFAGFSNSRSISNTGNKEYFQNTSNLAILAMITDLEAWIGLLRNDLPLQPQCFLASILCWINRQLTNPQAITLLVTYNKDLQQRLAIAMNYIYEHGFLRTFAELDQKGLCTFAPHDLGKYHARSTTIKIRPLPKGYAEEINSYAVQEYWHPDHWQTFHNELFGKAPGNNKVSVHPVIHPSQWHPHLVTTLLKALVRFLYGRIHMEVSTEQDNYEQSFSYITQCLPYAHPTHENLDALRAIVYLYPQVTPAWNPPEGLWPLLAEFLQKYDRSTLSSEELRLFVLWLNSTEHSDIITYTDQ